MHKRTLALLLLTLTLLLSGCGRSTGPTDDVGWDELNQDRSDFDYVVPAEPDRQEELERQEEDQAPTWFESLAATSSCSCSGNIYNCSDFASDDAAMACMLRCYEQTGTDIHWLDGDDDGLACEWNP